MNELGAAGKPFVFLVDFEMNKIIVTQVSDLGEDLMMSLPGFRHEPPTPAPKTANEWTPLPMPYQQYAASYDKVLQEINLGNTFLLNLAHPTPLSYSGTLADIYHAATAKYKVCLADQFVMFSPETFITIEDGHIYTYPMKGTIDSSVPEALELILANQKELAEHYTIVDLLRNDLSIVAKEVEVTRFRYPDYVNTTQDRGYYTGVCGYFDGARMDTGVMIRYVEQTAYGYQYRSGGGITFQSDCATEYREMLQKIYLPTPVTANPSPQAAPAT